MLGASIALAIIVASFAFSVQTAESQSETATEQQVTQVVEKKTLFTEGELQQLAYASAAKYGANKHELFVTAKCEAKKRVVDGVLYFDASAKSDIAGEESYGLAQWHLPSRNTNFAGTTVTLAQATDPQYSLDLMAHYFATGKKGKWSCYRLHYA